MRTASVLRFLAALFLLASLALMAGAWLGFRGSLAAKIDHAEQIDREAARPAAAARLEAVLLERRIAAVSQGQSQAIVAAFHRADTARALADYRAAGGDAATAGEAERALTAPVSADADIGLMRAISSLRAQSSPSSPPARPQLPERASPEGKLQAAAGLSALLACLFAWGWGRAGASKSA